MYFLVIYDVCYLSMCKVRQRTNVLAFWCVPVQQIQSFSQIQTAWLLLIFQIATSAVALHQSPHTV